MKLRFNRYALLSTIVLGLFLCLSTSSKACILKQKYIALPAGIVEGRLDNGLRYVILPNEFPRHNIEVRMIMNVGSLQEEDDQRGGAHFLEHSAFIGTKHFPQRSLIDYFEHQGMKFGRDINAFTGFDRTIYCLSLPNYPDNTTLLDSTFLALRDWLCDIDFNAERVKKERGVIVEELRAYQQDDDFYALKMGENRYAERIPLGTENNINSIDSERLKSFYHRWYKPSHATVVVVGDVKAPEVIALLNKAMGTIPVAQHDAAFKPYPMTYKKGDAWMQLADSIKQENKLELIIPHPTIIERTLQDAVDKQRMHMLVQCLSSRLTTDDVKCNVSNAWYLADKDHFVFAFHGAASAALADQVAATSNECHRLLKYGVGRDELHQLIQTRLEHLQPNTSQRFSDALCDDLTDYVLSGDRAISDSNDLEWVRNQVQTTTTQHLQTLLEEVLQCKKQHCLYAYTHATDSTGSPLLTAASVNKVWKKGWKTTLKPYVFHPKETEEEVRITLPDCLRKEPVYTDKFIKARHHWTDLGVDEITLTNGIRLIVRPTMDGDSTVYISALGRGGTADLPAKMQQKYHDAVSYVDMGGLAKTCNDTLLAAMTQKELSMTVGQDAYWYQLLASAPTGKTSALFNLVYEKMCHPGINRDDFAESIASEIESVGKESVLERLMSHDIDRLMSNTIDSLVGNVSAGDGQVMTKAALQALNIDTLTTYYKQLFSNPNGLTIILTGDFNPQQVIPRAVATFAQMKAPAAALPLMGSPFIPNQQKIVRAFEGGNDHQTVLKYVFAGSYDPSLQASLSMKLIRDVLQDRVLKVLREGANIVYSPYVDLYYDGVPQQKYNFIITLSVKDENRQQCEQLLKDILDELKEKPISEAELYKMKRSFLVTKDKVLTDKAPTEWKKALMTLVKNGESLSDFNDYPSVLHSITPKMLQEMINEMLNWNHRIVVYKSQKQ